MTAQLAACAGFQYEHGAYLSCSFPELCRQSLDRESDMRILVRARMKFLKTRKKNSTSMRYGTRATMSYLRVRAFDTDIGQIL